MDLYVFILSCALAFGWSSLQSDHYTCGQTVASTLIYLHCIFYVPCLVRVRPYGIFTRQCMRHTYILSLYVPCLVRVRPHFGHFHQALCACNTCVALLFSVLLYIISNQCRITVLKFTVSCG